MYGSEKKEGSNDLLINDSLWLITVCQLISRLEFTSSSFSKLLFLNHKNYSSFTGRLDCVQRRKGVNLKEGTEKLMHPLAPLWEVWGCSCKGGKQQHSVSREYQVFEYFQLSLRNTLHVRVFASCLKRQVSGGDTAFHTSPNFSSESQVWKVFEGGEKFDTKIWVSDIFLGCGMGIWINPGVWMDLFTSIMLKVLLDNISTASIARIFNVFSSCKIFDVFQVVINLRT